MTKAGFSEHFGFVALTTEELSSLDKEERAFILAASLITNDIRFYWSLMARSPVDGHDTDLRSMQLVRWLWASRKLASVLFEAIETLDAFCGKLPAIKSLGPVVRKEIRKGPMLKVAKTYRNLATHHFSGVGIDSHLLDFSSSAEHTLFAHPQQGNSISAISEQIFTLPTLRKIAPNSALSDFDDWCRACSNDIMKFCDKGTSVILIDAFPDKIYQTKPVPLKNEAEPPTHRWPLFLVVEPDSR